MIGDKVVLISDLNIGTIEKGSEGTIVFEDNGKITAKFKERIVSLEEAEYRVIPKYVCLYEAIVDCRDLAFRDIVDFTPCNEDPRNSEMKLSKKFLESKFSASLKEELTGILKKYNLYSGCSNPVGLSVREELAEKILNNCKGSLKEYDTLEVMMVFSREPNITGVLRKSALYEDGYCYCYMCRVENIQALRTIEIVPYISLKGQGRDAISFVPKNMAFDSIFIKEII